MMFQTIVHLANGSYERTCCDYDECQDIDVWHCDDQERQLYLNEWLNGALVAWSVELLAGRLLNWTVGCTVMA